MRQYAGIDVHFDEHPSNAWMELEELGLHAVGIIYCNRTTSDGFVPDHQLRKFGASGKGPKVVKRLIEKGKWTPGDRNGETGYWIEGYLDHNDSRAEIEAKIAKKRKAGEVGGRRSWQARAEAYASALAEPTASANSKACAESGAEVRAEPITNTITNTITTSNTSERETREASPAKRAKASRQARGTRIDESWEPSEKTLERYRAKGVDALASVDRFRNHWLASSSDSAVKVDWQAAFRTWVDRDIASGVAAPWRAPRNLLDRVPATEPQKGQEGPPASPEAHARIAEMMAAILEHPDHKVPEAPDLTRPYRAS